MSPKELSLLLKLKRRGGYWNKDCAWKASIPLLKSLCSQGFCVRPLSEHWYHITVQGEMLLEEIEK